MRRSLPALSREGGVSLVELVVASFIVGLLITEIWAMMFFGARYMVRSNETLELQLATLKSLNWLSRELAEGSPVSFRNETEETAPIKGIVFSMPRDTSGRVRYASGRIQWASYVCYYLDESGPNTQLIRAVEGFAPQDTAPTIPPSHGVDHFATSPSVSRRLVATNITAFTVTQSGDGLRVEMTAENPDQDTAIDTMTVLDMKN